jgi:hypothetical protein
MTVDIAKKFSVSRRGGALRYSAAALMTRDSGIDGPDSHSHLGNASTRTDDMPNIDDILYEPIRITWARKCLQRSGCDHYVKSYPASGDGSINARFSQKICEHCGRTVIGQPLD